MVYIHVFIATCMSPFEVDAEGQACFVVREIFKIDTGFLRGPKFPKKP